ncbi:hypothetical protein, partial [Vibrio parahaemolyticus]|uniref:hypothetical protein n=1 Tax=Vibrio parahaemolyticus TaxID=670 RepID=UPI00301D1540
NLIKTKRESQNGSGRTICYQVYKGERRPGRAVVPAVAAFIVFVDALAHLAAPQSPQPSHALHYIFHSFLI